MASETKSKHFLFAAGVLSVLRSILSLWMSLTEYLDIDGATSVRPKDSVSVFSNSTRISESPSSSPAESLTKPKWNESDMT